jgi:hypothetical protein
MNIGSVTVSQEKHGLLGFYTSQHQLHNTHETPMIEPIVRNLHNNRSNEPKKIKLWRAQSNSGRSVPNPIMTETAVCPMKKRIVGSKVVIIKEVGRNVKVGAITTVKETPTE